MKRVPHLHRPSGQTWNRNLAVAALGLVLACISMHSEPVGADEVAPGVAGALDVKSCAKPVWPPEALAGKHTGTVTMSLLIGPDGKVKQSRIIRSSGYRELDIAAREGIAKCSFRPGTVEGKPAEAWMQMQYVWELP